MARTEDRGFTSWKRVSCPSSALHKWMELRFLYSHTSSSVDAARAADVSQDRGTRPCQRFSIACLSTHSGSGSFCRPQDPPLSAACSRPPPKKGKPGALHPHTFVRLVCRKFGNGRGSSRGGGRAGGYLWGSSRGWCVLSRLSGRAAPHHIKFQMLLLRRNVEIEQPHSSKQRAD
eukprot:1982386-Rhodomonas_salina.1